MSHHSEPTVIDLLSDSEEEEAKDSRLPASDLVRRTQLTGLQKNPSGQSTLAFDKRVRLQKNGRTASEENTNQNRRKIAQPALTSFLSKGPSSAACSSKTAGRASDDTLKISITKNEIKINMKNQLNSQKKPPRRELIKPNARKTMRSFTADIAQGPDSDDDFELAAPIAVTEEEEEVREGQVGVVTLSSDDDELKSAIRSSQSEGAVKRQAEEESVERRLGGAVTIKRIKTDVIIPEKIINVTAAVSKVVGKLQGLVPPDEYMKVQKKISKKAHNINKKFENDSKVVDSVLSILGQLELLGPNPTNEVYLRIKDLLDLFKPYTAERKQQSAVSSAVADDVRVEKRKVQLTLVPMPKDEQQMVAGGKERVAESTSHGERKEEEEKEPIAKEQRAVSSSHLRKLRKSAKQCLKEIHRLENQEVQWDDDAEEEDDTYERLGKYRERYVTLHRKIAALEGMSANLGRSVEKNFRFQMSRYKEINVKISKYINREKSKEGVFVFPDFKDVLGLVGDCNEKYNLGLNPKQVETEARETFNALGNRLKQLRMTDDFDSLCSYMPAENDEGQDPAQDDEVAQTRFQHNADRFNSQMQALFDDFAAKQDKLGEKPEEVPDNAGPDDDKDDDEDEEKEEEDVQRAEMISADIEGQLDQDGDEEQADEEELAKVVEESSSSEDEEEEEEEKASLPDIDSPKGEESGSSYEQES